MQIAFSTEGEQRRGRDALGEAAVAAAPKNFAAHKALGDALLASNDIDGAIAELERAQGSLRTARARTCRWRRPISEQGARKPPERAGSAPD
jgi:hypothetical protein